MPEVGGLTVRIDVSVDALANAEDDLADFQDSICR